MGATRQPEDLNVAHGGPMTPDEYITSLPPERQTAMREVREVMRRNLPAGFEEGMQFGMIAWYVPLERFPDTYNGKPLGLAALASQKGYMSLYLNSVYGDPTTRPGSSSDTRRRASG